MTCLTVLHGFGRPSTGVFLCHRSTAHPPRPAFQVFEQAVSFVLGSLLKGLGLSTCTFLCIVSLRVGGVSSQVLGGGDISYGLGVFDFSHEEVKRPVVCIYRFFSLHSSRCIRLCVPRNK